MKFECYKRDSVITGSFITKFYCIFKKYTFRCGVVERSLNSRLLHYKWESVGIIRCELPIRVYSVMPRIRVKKEATNGLYRHSFTDQIVANHPGATCGECFTMN